ncbi:MAG: Crp/Fnr family transcriptional regulator [Fimbriimonas sp.]|nr:Crp/Fnr family transcriptional regulator [Fimbriimonas sp.]
MCDIIEGAMVQGEIALRLVGWGELLTENQARCLLEGASYLSKSAGSTIFAQGDIDDSVYIIVSGGVSVAKLLDSGEERFIRQMGPGEHFGELAALDPAPRSTTIRATEPSDFVAIRRDAFLECLRQSEHLATKLLVAMARRIREADSRLDTRRPVSERLVAVLSELARGQDGRGASNEVTLRINRSDLAHRCNADVKTISRELTKLELAGLIFRRGRSIQMCVRHCGPNDCLHR